MIQSVLMLLAPVREWSEPPFTMVRQARCMATRPASGSCKDRRHKLHHGTLLVLAVAGNALGLTVFLTGLGLVLRLAEVMLS